MTEPVKVLVVDDSSFMRKAIKTMLEEDPSISVVGTARDGLEAVEKVEELNPDVVTLDIEMPRMNGLEALRVIMARHPLPVIVVSSLTEEGAKVTFEALDLGAVDYIPKHLDNLSVNILRIRRELVEKVKAVAGKRVTRRRHLTKPLPLEKRRDRFVAQRTGIVVIGASTGGPKAVEEVLKALPPDFPSGIVVVQHMPRQFTGPYAERLASICSLKVKEATSGDTLKEGWAFIAPGGRQMRIRKKGPLETGFVIDNNPPDALYKPSVDITFLSVAESFPGRSIAIVLTGMGSDGLKGSREIKKRGGKVIAQDESTSIVYGMPKAVVDEGIADMVLPLEKIPGELVNLV